MTIEEMKEAMKENPPVYDGPGVGFEINTRLRVALKEMGKGDEKPFKYSDEVYRRLMDKRDIDGEKEGDIDEVIKLVLAEV